MHNIMTGLIFVNFFRLWNDVYFALKYDLTFEAS